MINMFLNIFSIIVEELEETELKWDINRSKLTFVDWNWNKELK